MNRVVNIPAKFDLIDAYWTPKLVAELNGQHVRLAKLQGPFIWHQHPDEDELFYVVAGQLNIELRDHVVSLAQGDLYVVPRGVEHRPVATPEAHVMLFEPADTINTGDIRDERTVDEIDSL